MALPQLFHPAHHKQKQNLQSRINDKTRVKRASEPDSGKDDTLKLPDLEFTTGFMPWSPEIHSFLLPLVIKGPSFSRAIPSSS
jgi:hypothetical protein